MPEGKPVIINNVFLEAVAVGKNQYPASGLPEIAFVGKSNVGKSSLINCLINRRALARTSGQPGKTRTINFYNVESRLYFVDLPGYGYARAAKTEAAKWGKMAENYLMKRESLKNILLLLDIRHEPSENDKLMFEWLKYYGKGMTVVLTKADKLTKNEAAKNIALIKKSLPGFSASETPVIPFSSETKFGRNELWARIEEIISYNIISYT